MAAEEQRRLVETMFGEVRRLLVSADSLLSLAAYRGAGAVDDEWKADAITLVREIREITTSRGWGER